ncbi:class I SAM-dependent methyltransferase [uncultured Psychrobacter sp.]|uniref:class I SAM-dependent methyltransferase n=1 Tax=uncultured Psychrobacter sp. TaxID=259303 RepID=UPI0025970174|nr:class I SAM-dependent methyltransferase [uncultured Psychrobacter sp.]
MRDLLAQKKILDPCCGSRMFWFDKKDERAVFTDKRSEQHTLCDGRELIIEPDMVMDFTNLQFDDEQFHMVVFDPPHLNKIGDNSWMAKKYGKLDETWPKMIKDGFAECFRVLKPNGTLIFKWNETQILTKDILALTDQKPVVGHISGKRANTHWICFLKA